MADDGKRRGSDELKDALDHLKQAADKVAEKVLGSDVAQHLRTAAQHVVRAARASLDDLDRTLDEKKARAKADDTSPAP